MLTTTTSITGLEEDRLPKVVIRDYKSFAVLRFDFGHPGGEYTIHFRNIEHCLAFRTLITASEVEEA